MNSSTQSSKPLDPILVSGVPGSGPLTGSKHNLFGQALLSLRHSYALLVIEIPALMSGMDGLIKRLEVSGQSLDQRLNKISGQPVNQKILAHMIGVERWGQRRLAVALGEPLCEDNFEGYQQGIKSWPQLITAFRAARKETISLVKSLRMAGINPKIRIPHNLFGEITLLGWIFYLNMHAVLESMRFH